MRHFTVLVVAAAWVCACERDSTVSPSALASTELAVGTAISADADSAAFTGIDDVATDSAGRVYVLDGESARISAFAPDGSAQFRFGSAGDSIGEMTSPCCMAFAPNGILWVRDGGNSRYVGWHVGADTAAHIASLRMVHTDARRNAPVIFDANGRIIDIGARATESGAVAIHHFHLDSAGAIVRVQQLPAPPADSTGMQMISRTTTAGRRMRLFTYQPHGPGELRAHGPNGEYAHGISNRYVIDWRDANGELLRTIRGEVVSGPPLSDDEAQRADSLIDRLADQVEVARADLGLNVPDTKQPIRLIYFDAEGRLWVELSATGGERRRAHVYDRNGERVLDVSWPGNVELHNGDMRGATFWGIAQDSLGAQSVVRLQ